LQNSILIYQKSKFEQKIPGRHKIRWIFLLSIIFGHL